MATATAHAVYTRTEILAPTSDFRRRRVGSSATTSPAADSIFDISADAKRVSFGSSSSSSSASTAGLSRGFGGFGEGRAASSASSGSFDTWADDFDALDGEFDVFADYDFGSDVSVDPQLSDDDGFPASSSASSASASSDEAAPSSSPGQGALPDTTTMNLLHCLFALAFAAFTLGVLTFTGVVVRTSGSSCPATMGYSWCAVIQDLRSILSFVLGALLCWLFTRGKDGPDSEAAVALGGGGGAVSGGGWMGRVDKVQLYAYML